MDYDTKCHDSRVCFLQKKVTTQMESTIRTSSQLAGVESDHISQEKEKSYA